MHTRCGFPTKRSDRGLLRSAGAGESWPARERSMARLPKYPRTSPVLVSLLVDGSTKKGVFIPRAPTSPEVSWQSALADTDDSGIGQRGKLCTTRRARCERHDPGDWKVALRDDDFLARLHPPQVAAQMRLQLGHRCFRLHVTAVAMTEFRHKAVAVHGSILALSQSFALARGRKPARSHASTAVSANIVPRCPSFKGGSCREKSSPEAHAAGAKSTQRV